MSLPRFSVRRPVFTTMVTLIIVILGAVSLDRLRIDLLPDVEMPTMSVRTSFEGASPEVMELLVTQIVEEIVATVPGVERIESESEEGRSTVRVTFGWDVDVDAAAAEMRSTLEDEISELPDDITRPRIRKFDVNSFPVVIIGVSSNIDPVELTQLVEDQVRYRFGRIPGVAQVDLWGGFNREVRIELKPDRIRAQGLGMDQVLDAIRDANLDRPAGKIEQGRYEVTLRAPAQFQDLEQIRNTVVTMRDGAPITLGQVADVLDTYEKLTEYDRINGVQGIRVAIRKEANANTVEVSRAILEEIDRINDDLPQARVVPVINQGNFIERSIANVANSVLYGGALAILVLLFFLRNIRSTIVISLAIPISIVATFALVYFGGFTLNLMTLGGLALGVGMMVDNSIVVLENIFRHRDENKEDNETASVEGAIEVSGAIIASTITTLVIFLPLVFIRGVSGVLFQELAYVIVFSLVCSLLVSLSLVPMLASKLIKPHDADDGPRGMLSRIGAAAERGFKGVDNLYRDLLNWVLHMRTLTVLAALAALGASLLLVPYIGTEFLPPSDEGEVRISGEMEPGTKLEILNDQVLKMEKIIYPATPEAVAVIASAEENAEADIRLSLGPAAQRQRSNTEIADDLRQKLEGQIPGMNIRVRAPQGQFLLQRLLGGDEGLTVEVRGFEMETLDLLAQRVAEAIKDVPGITDVELSREAGVPQEELTVDRAKAADLGLSVRDIAEVIETAIAGTQAGEYRAMGNSYRILVQLQNAQHMSIDEVLDMTVTSPNGEQIALRNVVTTEPGRGPITIERKDQQRIVTVQANVAGRDLGSVAGDVSEVLDQIARPVGYDLNIAGNYEEQQEAFRELIVSLGLALVLVYMVMACQYESFRDPLIVMFSVPLAAIGVLITLFLTDTTLNVQSYIGCIMLGGIVVNNAILLVDQAGQLRVNHGMGTRAAVAEAGRRRLRPILMTTMTTILGLLPLALGIGEGADAQAPLARAVIGGLTSSTVITLVLIPVIYSLIHPEPKGATS